MNGWYNLYLLNNFIWMNEVKVSNLVEVRIFFALLRKSHTVVIYVSWSDNKPNPESVTEMFRHVFVKVLQKCFPGIKSPSKKIIASEDKNQERNERSSNHT